MPPPSPSFPLSDSRNYRYRLPPPSSLPPPSALYAGSFATPSPTLYSPGPLPSPRCLEIFPDSSKFIGVYASGGSSYGYGSSVTTPPLTPGFSSESSPTSPTSSLRKRSICEPERRRKVLSACAVSSLLAAAPANDGDSSSSSAGSTPSGSPTFARRDYWNGSASGTSTPNTSPSESEDGKQRGGSVSSITSISEDGEKEEDERVAVIERQQFAGMKRRRLPSYEEEDCVVKRRRESSASIMPVHHRSLSMRSDSSPPSDNEDGDSDREEYDVLGRKKPKTPRTPVSWDPEDDRKLIHLKEVQKLGWKQISTYFKKRTSHACQFRWRRLTSGTLKYYQGQRRPPMIPPMTPPEYSSPSPKQLPLNPPPAASVSKTHSRRPSLPMTPPVHTPVHGSQASSPNGYFSIQPSQASVPWAPSEDRFLLDKKLSFAEVNVILNHRSESEIWQRMGELRYGVASMPTPSATDSEDRRGSLDE